MTTRLLRCVTRSGRGFFGAAAVVAEGDPQSAPAHPAHGARDAGAALGRRARAESPGSAPNGPVSGRLARAWAIPVPNRTRGGDPWALARFFHVFMSVPIVGRGTRRK